MLLKIWDKTSERHQFKHKTGTNYQEIITHIKTLPQYKLATTIIGFTPHQNEPNLLDLYETTTKEVYLPIYKENTYQFNLFTSKKTLKKGKFGILEALTNAIPLNQLPLNNIWLVPAISIDKNGNRLGHGNGYYDQFLKHQTGTKIGIIYHSQLSKKSLPSEKHDIKMDIVITDQQIYQINA